VIDRNLIDWSPKESDGYPDELAKEDTRDALMDVCGSAAREFPASFWIEPKHWVEKAKENDANKTWAMNRVSTYSNQNPSHLCTCHSLATNFQVARNIARGVIFPDGPKKNFRYEESAKFCEVWVSPLSVYAEANPQEWGGANVRQVLEIAVRRGMLPDLTQPREYGFRHQLTGTSGKGNMNQSGGKWVPLSKFPEGWKETAKHFRPLEVVFPESFEQAMCLVLNGYAVSVGRNQHAVPWCQWLWKEELFALPDSYDVTRYDSMRLAKTAWRGSFSIISTTVPDSSWEKPAG